MPGAIFSRRRRHPKRRASTRSWTACRRPLDGPTRMAMWRELQPIANGQSWLIWLPVQVSKIPVRSRIGNMRPTAVSIGLTGVAWNAEQLFVKDER